MRLLALGLALAGLAFTAHGLWIPVKAALAQHLLERAWRETRTGEPGLAPWPWADTWPVARLGIGGETVIVLADSGGEGLAFGPTHVAGSAPPGAPGTVVVSAHRDTHFRGLDEIGEGAAITLEATDGSMRRYRVTGRRLLDRPELPIPEPDAGNTLVLVTCWPLGGIDTDTPQRFALIAEEDSPKTGDAR